MYNRMRRLSAYRLTRVSYSSPDQCVCALQSLPDMSSGLTSSSGLTFTITPMNSKKGTPSSSKNETTPSSKKGAKKGAKKHKQQEQEQEQQQEQQQEQPAKVMTMDLLQDCLYVFLRSCHLIGGPCQELLEQPGRLLDWMEAANMEQVSASWLLRALHTRVAEAAGTEREHEVFEEV
jgi:hypothetical protein